MSKNRNRACALPLLAIVASCHYGPDRDLMRQRSESLYGAYRGARFEQEPTMPERPTASDLVAAADLNTYLRFGLHENGRLRAAFERWHAAIQRATRVSALPDPTFSFSQFVEEVQTRTGPQERRYSLSQTFPWFGKLELRGAVATSAAEEAWQRVVATRLGVEREIRVAFFEYAYLAQSIRITGEIRSLLQQLDPVVQRRIAGGTSGQQDLTRLQIEIGRIENELASFERFRPALSARLAAAMNWHGSELLPMPELTEPDLRILDVESLMQRADERNPELRQLDAKIQTNLESLDLAELERWPDVTLGVDYLETGEATTMTPGSGDDPIGLRVMFNLPIWGSKDDAAEREAERNISAARYELRNRRSSMRSEVEYAAFQMEDAARQVALYRDTLLPRARESLAITRAAYRAGSASLLDLIDSERALLEFETGYWRACRDHYQSDARLEAILGGEMR